MKRLNRREHHLQILSYELNETEAIYRMTDMLHQNITTLKSDFESMVESSFISIKIYKHSDDRAPRKKINRKCREIASQRGADFKLFQSGSFL